MRHLRAWIDLPSLRHGKLCVNKPHCAAAVRPWESEATTSTLPPARVRGVSWRLKSASKFLPIMVTKKKNQSRSYLNHLVFRDRPCKKRADDLLKLSRHRLKMVTAIYTGHAPVRGHLYIMGLFDGDTICSFCGMEAETVQHIICCCEALARQRYNVFGRLTVEPKDISTASVRDLCLFIRDAGLLRLCWMKY